MPLTNGSIEPALLNNGLKIAKMAVLPMNIDTAFPSIIFIYQFRNRLMLIQLVNSRYFAILLCMNPIIGGSSTLVLTLYPPM